MSFETVAAALPLAGAAFRSCIYGIEVFSKAYNIGVSGDAIRCKLDIEAFRLIQWAEKSGLYPKQKGNPRLNWELIADILRQEKELLTSAAKLRDRYRLNFEEESIQGAQLIDLEPVKPTSTLTKLISKLKPDLRNETARVIHSKNNTLSAIRWASLGQDQANNIVKDIVHFNDKLFQLLETADRDHLQNVLTALLRDIVSRTTNNEDLNTVHRLLEVQSIAARPNLDAATTLKQIRLSLGADQRDDETRTQGTPKSVPHVHLRKLKKSKLALMDRSSKATLDLASYSGERVAVEWRSMAADINAELRKQIQELAVFLHLINDPTFHALTCCGYIEDPSMSQYAMVYSMPIDYNETSQIWTLKQLISCVETPSLSLRLSIALALSEAILQLHTSGWLHKGLSSENVVFLGGKTEQPWEVFSKQPFLVGYEYARPDTASALTEGISFSLVANMYRHPTIRGEQSSRFCKQFDLYGLGCVLLEVALWKEIVDLNLDTTRSNWRERIDHANEKGLDLALPSIQEALKTTNLRSKISFQVGERFCEAIVACFAGAANPDGTVDSVIDALTDEASLKTQHYILGKLQQCSF